jgi:hypothetical protein
MMPPLQPAASGKHENGCRVAQSVTCLQYQSIASTSDAHMLHCNTSLCQETMHYKAIKFMGSFQMHMTQCGASQELGGRHFHRMSASSVTDKYPHVIVKQARSM